MGVKEIKVKDDGRQGLLLQGLVSTEGPDAGAWEVQDLGHEQYLLSRQSGNNHSLVDATVGQCSPPILFDFMSGLFYRGWTGCLNLMVEGARKAIYFKQGELCFAKSDLIDDRLGEVIYRRGLISLEDLTDAAVMVDKSTKFGQVLLERRIFDHMDLWQALQAQIEEIIRSVFMFDRLNFSVQAGSVDVPTEVVFQRSTLDLLTDAFCYGSLYRDFVGRIHPDSEFRFTEEFDPEAVSEGTFRSDIINLIQEQSTVARFLAASKLNDRYTAAELMRLEFEGLVQLTHVDPYFLNLAGETFSGIKARLDLYSVLLENARLAFENVGVRFPAESMRAFVHHSNPAGFIALTIDKDGSIGREIVKRIVLQCQCLTGRTTYFEKRLDGMIRFLMQIASDILPFDAVRTIKENYRSLTS